MRINDPAIPTATAADLKAGNYLVLDGAEGTKKIPAELAEGMPHLRIVSNTEYVYALVDSNDVFLFGIKKDGSVEWAKGVPEPVKTYVQGLIDGVGGDVSALAERMAAVESGKVDKVEGKGLVNSVFADGVSVVSNNEFVFAIVDSENKLLFGIDRNGKVCVFSEVDFAAGFSGNFSDHTKEKSLEIAEPRKAFVNFTGISAMPTTKTDNYHAYMEFYDGNGNYFRKKVIANAQGSSSLGQPKKNISIDICNDDWKGDDTFSLKIGDWIIQDSFHLKAYHTDYFRGSAVAAYHIFDAIQRTRGTSHDRTWKDGLVDFSKITSGQAMGYGVETETLLRLENGARCFPDGFPCEVFLNGSFYGIFSFQLKKHRDNYCMNKAVAEHIHLDGNLASSDLFAGTVEWDRFEIRNPKNLYCIDGSEYDGDNPSEIVDAATAESWISAGELPSGKEVTSKIAKNLRLTAKVRGYIEDFALATTKIHSQTTEELKRAEFEKYFDPQNLIDYQIFGDAVGNTDGFAKNWQWTTWDGVKWFVNPYDLDVCFGNMWTGEFAKKPLTSHIRDNSWYYPNYYAIHYYGQTLESRWAELRKLGVISEKFFMDNIIEWVLRVGKGAYENEFRVWNDVPCNRLLSVNEDYWELVLDESGNPVISASSSEMYDSARAYNVNDTCVAVMNVFDSSNDPGWYYTFKCVSSCIGQVPAKFGYCDSIFRIAKWVAEEIENMDSLYNYQEV